MLSEGDEVRECPRCDTMMLFEMSFLDQFNHTTGHYTTDYPIAVCPHCGHTEDYIYENEN